MSILNCLIIEDEKPASDLLAGYVKDIPGLELAGVCEDVFSATRVLHEQHIDLIFLDINLPQVSGIDFLKSLSGRYSVIITSAYDSYAIKGYDLDVIDYLLKPVSFERFLKAVNKVVGQRRDAQPKATEPLDDYFFVKAESRFEKINIADILYIEGLQNYIAIYTIHKKVITYSSLKSIEEYLPERGFLRVQKSFIVSVSKIDSIDGDDVIIGKVSIPISRGMKEEVLKALLNNRLYRPKGF